MPMYQPISPSDFRDQTTSERTGRTVLGDIADTAPGIYDRYEARKSLQKQQEREDEKYKQIQALAENEQLFKESLLNTLGNDDLPEVQQIKTTRTWKFAENSIPYMSGKEIADVISQAGVEYRNREGGTTEEVLRGMSPSEYSAGKGMIETRKDIETTEIEQAGKEQDRISKELTADILEGGRMARAKMSDETKRYIADLANKTRKALAQISAGRDRMRQNYALWSLKTNLIELRHDIAAGKNQEYFVPKGIKKKRDKSNEEAERQIHLLLKDIDKEAGLTTAPSEFDLLVKENPEHADDIRDMENRGMTADEIREIIADYKGE